MAARLVLSMLILSSFSVLVMASSDSDSLVIEESGDAPGNLWESDEIGESWQILSSNNSTVIGSFQVNDSVDVYALEISSTNWTTVGFWLSNNDTVRISVQRLNQSTWSIIEFSNGRDGKLDLDPGFHAVRIEKIGNSENPITYRFTLENLGSFDGEGKFVNLSSMFLPFYIFAGMFLILPLIIVLWWNRGNILQSASKDGTLTDREKHLLDALRTRFSSEQQGIESEEIDASKSLLGEKFWDSISEEVGDPETTYYTGNINICSWRLGESRDSFLIGIDIGGSGWDMAAIRIFSPLGEEISISGVIPDLIFQGDEVFIGNLLPRTTTFVQIEITGSPQVVNMNISGLVDGEPVAAFPTKPIKVEEE